MLDQIELNKCASVYNQLMGGNISNFTFYFSGPIDMEKLRPLVERYLASIPAADNQLKPANLKMYPPEGKINKVVYAGSEPKSSVVLEFSGTYDFSAKNNKTMDALKEIIQISLLQRLREQENGAYSPYTIVSYRKVPEQRFGLSIRFYCAPENVDKLVAAALDEVNKIKLHGPDTESLEKFKAEDRRNRELKLKEDFAWVEYFKKQALNHEDFNTINNYDEILGQDISDKFKELWYVVGNTPMLELCYEYNGNSGLYTLYQAYKSCKIKPGDTIIVVSGGDTGISFSAIGKALGHPVKIIIPEGSNEERIFTAVKMGAEVIVVSGEQRSLSSRIKLSEEMALKGDVFLPRQFEKKYDVEAHERTTGKEIWRQLASNGIIADAFVTGVGTGGTIMGTSNYLKMLNPKTKIHPLELADSRNLTNSLTIGNSHIMGAADGFMPTLVKLNELDEIIQVNNADAITMAHMLAEQMELAIGISSGANVVAAIKLKEKMGPTATIYFLEYTSFSEKAERQNSSIVYDLKLLQISGVAGINAFFPDQLITLGPNLTIIYGANGSGKSGYIRLLINAAEFIFESAGAKSVFYYPTDCGHAEFEQFSVFDEKAVHAHLNNKNQFDFRPAGLSFFADLNEAYKKLEEFVQADIDKHTNNTNLVLSKTKLENLRVLLPFTAEDKAARTKLEGEKAVLTALKKDKEIQDLELQQNLLASLKSKLIKASDKIKDCVEKEGLAAGNNIDEFKNTPLNSVGGTEWRTFIVAADVFARLQDTGGGSYPQTDDNCLLCQQPLTQEAVSLVSAYWAFIKSNAEQDSNDTLSKLELNILPDTGILHKWLSENKPTELALIKTQISAQLKLRNAIVANISAKKAVSYEAFQIDTNTIDSIRDDIGERVKKLKEADVAEAIENLQKQITIFNHREKLEDQLQHLHNEFYR
eukprot:gene7874-7942_t